MLKKEYRITKKKEFDLIFSKGKSRQIEELGVKLIMNNLTFNRFGIIISNKVSKLAVTRNLIRRRIRANISKIYPNITSGYDIVIITRPSIIKFSNEEINTAMLKIFRSLKIYHE